MLGCKKGILQTGKGRYNFFEQHILSDLLPFPRRCGFPCPPRACAVKHKMPSVRDWEKTTQAPNAKAISILGSVLECGGTSKTGVTMG